MALPDFSMRQLLEAGVHFGHQKHRWNPRMGQYIFGVRNNIHIMDLAKTVPLLHQALKAVSDTVAGGGRVLLVGTKRQAQEPVADAARRSAQYFVNARWLGGMLTNWKTVSNSITQLRQLEDKLATEAQGLTKKELLNLERSREKLERNLGGIKDMAGLPDLIFIIDTNREGIAINEANNLNIPVAAILDSNSDPSGITYPIPGNDDAARALSLYCDLVARSAIDGISRMQGSMPMDAGASEEPVEMALEAAASDVPATEAIVDEPALVEVEVPEAPAASDDDAGEVDEGLRFTPPEGQDDNLKNLTGVGPALEKKLKDVGLVTFAQIAALTAEQIELLDEQLNLGGRIDRDDWVAQSAEFVNG